jgi:hypothetical protein
MVATILSSARAIARTSLINPKRDNAKQRRERYHSKA